MKVLRRMIRKEFLQLRQDRKMIPMLIGAPLIQLIVLGFAANLDVHDIPLLSYDQDHTVASRALLDRFLASGYFQLAGTVEAPADIDRALVQGTAQVALVVRRGYGRALEAGRAGPVQLLADGTESSIVSVALGYASTIVSTQAGELAAARLRRVGSNAPTRPGTIQLTPRIWYNPDLKSRWFYVPAILAMVMMLTTMVLPSMAVVREREIGTLEQIIVTPIRPWQLILGKLLPFVLVGVVNVVMVIGATVWLFGVPLRGSFFLLLGLSLLFLLSTLGLGLLISTLVRNQQQAMMTSIFLAMVPMIYLSGLIFPIENMPRPIQLSTYVIPLRYYNIILRGIFLRGAGLGTLWPDAVILTLFGTAILALASSRFSKRLD